MQFTVINIVDNLQILIRIDVLSRFCKYIIALCKHVVKPFMGACVITGFLGVPMQAIAFDNKLASSHLKYFESVFGLYADNRERGIGNYITADLALISYSLIRHKSIRQMEQNHIIPAFTAFVDTLAEALTGQQHANNGPASDEVADLAVAANIKLVSLMQALLTPEKADSLDNQALIEYELIVSAGTIAESTLWGRQLDYTQYQPRGRYAGDESMERYFRAFRYLSSQLFAIKPSSATGISKEESLLQTAQLAQLVRLINDNTELLAKRQTLDSLLSWQFGQPEDLRDSDVLQVLDTITDSSDFTLLSEQLFAKAVTESRQPKIIDGLVQINLLEKGLTMHDVMTGWRLFSSRFTVQTAIQQVLLFDNTKNYTGPENEFPFGYGVVNGKAVKSYPTSLEWLAFLGSSAAERQLQDTYETAFEGYSEATYLANDLLRFLQGAELIHAEIAREGLSMIDHQSYMKNQNLSQVMDFESINGFLAWQSFLEILYSRQSYTASAKGLVLMAPVREGAGLDVAPELYRLLAHAARLQWQHSEVASWQRFSDVMDRLAVISSSISYGAELSAADVSYLNEVDKILLNLTEVEDQPIVVDVHTNPNENLVVQQATGFARVVEAESAIQTPLRGARLSFHEFKQVMDERLTTETWLEQLNNMQKAADTSF